MLAQMNVQYQRAVKTIAQNGSTGSVQYCPAVWNEEMQGAKVQALIEAEKLRARRVHHEQHQRVGKTLAQSSSADMQYCLTVRERGSEPAM